MATKQQPPITPEVPNDEIDLRELFLTIWNRKWMVVGVTIIFIGIASFYNDIKPTTYQTSIILSPPSEATVLEINKEGIFKESKDSLFRRFLEKFTTPEFQVAVLKDKGYLDQLTQDIKGDFDEIQVTDDFFEGFKLVEKVTKKKGQEDKFFDPNRLEFELLGADKNLIQNYLNDLKSAANQQEIEELEEIFNSRIKNQLNEITRESYELNLKAKRDREDRIKIIEEEDSKKITNLINEKERLRVKAKQDRRAKIKQIEESDANKITNLLNEKERLRVKAKQDRLNQIDRLIEAKDIADEMGIIENNFKKIQSDNTATLNLSIGDNQKLPDWYLYGSKVLAKRINLLTNRKNDDSFIPRITEIDKEIQAIKENPELLKLKQRKNDDAFIARITEIDKEIQAIKENTELKTLKERESDNPYIERLRVLDVEKTRLKSFKFNPEGWRLVTTDKIPNIGQPTKSKKPLIIAIAGVLGVLVGLILIPILNILRQEKEAS